MRWKPGVIWPICPLALLLAAAGGCAEAAAPTPERGGAATATAAQPSETPAPDLQVTVVELIAGERPNAWTALGLVENRTDSALEDIELRLELLDAAGEPIAERLVAPALPALAAGGASPFTADFSRVHGAASVRASVDSRPARLLQRAELAIELNEQFVTPAGELAILGTLANPADQPVELLALTLLALDPQGRPRALAELRYGPARLAAGERVPFLAVARRNPGHVRWESFQAAVPSDASPGNAVELHGSPELRFTPQGAPFVIGEIQNASASARAVSLLLVLWEGSRALSLSEVRAPVPLDGGARLGFSAREFPGFTSRVSPEALDELRLQVRIESTPARSSALPLTVRVDAFHSVGSALFVRGSLTNEQTAALSRPAVLAEVRGLDGVLWTAGWTVLPEALEPGQVQEFVLELPLARELDLTSVEFDLRAFGSRAEN